MDVNNEVFEFPNPDGENNNTLKTAYDSEGFCFYIFDDSAFPIYPPEFAIVNDPNTVLHASSTNAFGERGMYVMQIDTTELFDSPMFREEELISAPSVIKWKPDLALEDGTVYYWRVAPLREDSAIWNGSSFIYLQDSSPGWNQSHLYQWQKDEFENYYYDDQTRDFLFAQNLSEISIKNGAFPQYKPTISVQNNPIEYLSSLGDGEIPSGLYITVLDGVTGLPWLNQPSPEGGLYDSELYTWWAENYPVFPFLTNSPENRAKAIKFLDETVPDDAYVVLFTIQRRDYPGIGNFKADEWASDAGIHPEGKDLMTLLESYGAERVRELEAGPKPYILSFRKNNSEFDVQEVIAPNIDSDIELRVQFLGSWFEGKMRSTRIGPAQNWNRLLWDLEGFTEFEDEIILNLYGGDINNQDSLLYENIDTFDLDLSFIDSEEYAYLRLELYSKDEQSKTSAQMPYWRVLYESKPEVVLDVDDKFSFHTDTLFVGERLQFCSTATNVSSSDMGQPTGEVYCCGSCQSRVFRIS